MTDKKSKGSISKSLLIAWAALMLSLLIILTWVALTPIPPETPIDETATSMDLQLPEALPLEDFLLKDKEKTEDTGGAASNESPASKKTMDMAENSASTAKKPYFPTYAAKSIDLPEGKIGIAFVFSELGLNEDVLEKIMEVTPAGITLAFLPQSPVLMSKISTAREKGHEVLLNIPMEPSDYPNTDTGPNTLLTGQTPEENLTRVQWAMANADQYIGLMNFHGSLFLASETDLHPVLSEVKKHGMAFVESEATYRSKAPEICNEMQIPYLKSNFVLNESLTPDELHAVLIRAEQMAKEKGSITIVVHTSPINLPLLLTWIEKAQEQDYVFLPVSQLLMAEQNKSKAVS